MTLAHKVWKAYKRGDIIHFCSGYVLDDGTKYNCPKVSKDSMEWIDRGNMKRHFMKIEESRMSSDPKYKPIISHGACPDCKSYMLSELYKIEIDKKSFGNVE